MTQQSDRVNFILRFCLSYPARPREETVHAAGQLLRLARKYQRLAEEECDGPGDYIHRIPYPRAGKILDQWQAGLEKRQEATAAKIRALCTEWSLPVDLGGDPRGYCVKVHFPDGKGNTWGGDSEGWGVPS